MTCVISINYEDNFKCIKFYPKPKWEFLIECERSIYRPEWERNSFCSICEPEHGESAPLLMNIFEHIFVFLRKWLENDWVRWNILCRPENNRFCSFANQICFVFCRNVGRGVCSCLLPLWSEIFFRAFVHFKHSRRSNKTDTQYTIQSKYRALLHFNQIAMQKLSRIYHLGMCVAMLLLSLLLLILRLCMPSFL